MTGEAPALRSVGGEEGGAQVAWVNRSTSFRMKKRGKVPPRLETLFRGESISKDQKSKYVLSIQERTFASKSSKGKQFMKEDSRGQERHISPANDRIRDTSVESADGDEHDRIGKGAENMAADDGK